MATIENIPNRTNPVPNYGKERMVTPAAQYLIKQIENGELATQTHKIAKDNATLTIRKIDTLKWQQPSYIGFTDDGTVYFYWKMAGKLTLEIEFFEDNNVIICQGDAESSNTRSALFPVFYEQLNLYVPL